MVKEYFYALTLQGAKASQVWNPHHDIHKVMIKQALLGPGATEGETNVVQVDTTTWRESIKIPVAVLNSGSTNQVLLDLSFLDTPFTFNLIQGSGPVHLIGHHLIESPNEDVEEEMTEDEEGEDEVEEVEDNDERPTNKEKKPTTQKAEPQ